MMIVARQRRAEVNRARQFVQEPQSLEGRKAQLDSHLLGVGNGAIDNNDCPAKVKAVDWRKPKSFQFLQSRATSLSREREQCSTTSSLSSARGAEARALDEGVCVTVKGTKEDCCRGYSNSVDWPQIFLCESNDSLLRIFGPKNFTGVADACSCVANLDNSVGSDCGDTQLRTGNTCTVRCMSGNVLGVGDTEQTFSCQPDEVVSGTQPVCEPLPCSAEKVDSEYGVDVCIDSADGRSCVVSCASGHSIVGDLAVRTCMTNDSWTGGFATGRLEPWQLSRVGLRWDCASGCVASNMDNAVFQCLVPPGMSDGTLQELNDLEGIAHNCDGVGLGDNCGPEGAHGYGTTAPPSKFTILLLRAHQSAVLPPSPSNDCDGLPLQEECTATCAESYEAKSSATALTTQICHFDGYTFADTGLQFQRAF